VAAAVPETRPAIHDAAFERLYRRYVKDVYRYTLALLQNPADAEDVTQTTFLNAWRAYSKGVDPVKPHNWLIKIAHNAARTRYATSARRPQEVPLEESAHELPVPSGDAEEVRGVLAALSTLPFNQRSALVMRELEGRSYGEIADALEVSVAAVETLIFRARRSLRVHRSKLRALGAVQLPPSLATFFESGGGAVVGGGALVGSGLLAKAAVVVATGIAAGGVGFGAVQASRGHSPNQAQDLEAPHHAPANPAFSPVRRLVAASPAVQAVRKASGPVGHTTKRRGPLRAHFAQQGAAAETATPASAGTSSAPVARAASPSPPAAREETSPPVTETIARTTPIVTNALPTVQAPPAPSVPKLPVTPVAPTIPPVPPVNIPPAPKLP
jgi:RNA polymerase sigma factor (sigma-70 family)